MILQTISKEIYDSQEEVFQFISRDLLNDNFSIWLKMIESSNDDYNIVSFFEEDYQYFHFVRFDLRNRLTFCLGQDECQYVYGIQQYQNAYVWFHLAISNIIKLEVPFEKIIFNDTFLQNSSIFLQRSPFYKCIIYKNLSDIKKYIKSFYYEKIVKPQEFIQVFSQQSVIQIFLKKSKKKTCSQEDFLLIFDYVGLGEIQFNDKDCNQFLWNNNSILNFTEFQVSQWFQVQIIINYQNIKFSLILNDLTYSDEYIIQSFDIVPLYFQLILNLKSMNYIFQSSNYYQFYNQNEIQLCHSYCQDCQNNKCLSCYTKDCECLENQFFNIIDKSCQYYSQLSSVKVFDYKKQITCQRGFIQTNYGCQQFCLLYEGQMSKECMLDQDKTSQYFEFQEDLLFRNIYLDPILQNLLYTQFFDPLEELNVNFNEELEDHKIILIKNKNVFLINNQQNDYKICRNNYFGDNCQFKPYKCLYSNNQNCQTCQLNYFLTAQKCKKCPKNCLICDYDKKKLICMIPQENYYINKLGIPQLCSEQCYMCKNDGSCINQQEILSWINCNQSDCLQQMKLECDIQNSIIIELAQQKCQRIYQSSNVFQWIQSVILSDIPFLGQYKIPFKEQLIVNSLNSNSTQVYFNKQVNLIYKFEQLKEIYYIILSDQLAEDELYNLQMGGLICTQKYIHLGKNRCLQYQQNKNIYDVDQSCFINNKCNYNLTLDNVYVMAEGIYHIVYENQEYSQIMALLSSIQNLGMVYGFVNINAQLIINKLNLKSRDYENMLVIQKQLLPKFLRNSQFQLILNYENKYYYENVISSFVFEIVADSVIINNLFAYNEIFWKIKCSELLFNNTKIIKTSFKLQIDANRIIIVNTLITDIRNFNMIAFRLYGDIQLLYISNFIIFNSQFVNNSIFQIANINKAFLYEVKIEECVFYDSILFNFNFQIQKLKMHGLIFLLTVFNQTTFIFMRQIMNFQLTFTEIKQIEKIGILPLFCLYLLNQGSIVDFYVYQSEFQFQVFSIVGCEKITFNNVNLQMTGYPFIEFTGDQIFLDNFKILLLNQDQLILFQIFSTYTFIENLQYIQKISNEITYKQPYFIIVSTKQGFLNNLKFDNIQMVGSGLLYLINKETKFLIQNLIINNCRLKMNTKKLPSLINLINYGFLIVQNIQIKSLFIENDQMDDQYQLISITGTDDKVTISNLQIENINSNTNNMLNFLFSLQNQLISINRFSIQNIVQINLFYIHSQNTQIQKGQIINLQSSDIYLVARNDKQVNIFIQIQKMQIDQLNGTFIKNKNIDESYVIILQNIQIIITCVQQQINIHLRNTDLYLINIYILSGEVDQQFENFDNNLITVQKVRLYLKNLTILNVCSSLGEFKFLQSAFIDGLLISNIQYIIAKQISSNIKPYISFIQNFTLVIINIHIYNSSFYFNDIIKIQINDGSLIQDRLQITNIRNLKSIFSLQFQQENNYDYFHFQNIFVQDIMDAQNLFYADSQNQISIIKFNNLFLRNNLIRQIFENKQNICIIFSNSLIYDIDHLFSQQGDFRLKIQNSEIINFRQQQFYKTIINNTVIFDERTESYKIQDQFSIDLSFNYGKSVLRTRHLESNIHQINLNNNNEQYFYLPSGQPITKYERLDLNNIVYKQIYNGFSIVVKGLEKQSIMCELKSTLNGSQIDVFDSKYLILNQTINLLNNLTAFINPFNIDYVVNDIICDSYILRFNVKSFRCQLGEYLFNNSCLQCDIQKGLYSTQYNSTHCQNVNYNQISKLKVGLVKLRQNYWRYSFNSMIIEQCQNENCNGGWFPGDQSCNNSRIGALCQECDVYNKQGNGYFTKNINDCQICEISYRLIYQFIFSILWQLFLTFLSIYSKDSLSKQLLFYKVGKRNFYKVLYKLSLDQPAVILKMLTTYLFYIYLIRQNFNSISQYLILNLNLVNNPNLIMEAQLDCIFRQIQNIEIIYVKFLFSLCNLLFISNIHFIVYLLYVKFGNKFQFKLLLLIIVEIFIFNLQIILEICFKLLSYQEISQIKWVQLNQSYQYYSKTHFSMIYQLIIPTTCILLLLPLIILFLFISNFTIMKTKIFQLFDQKYRIGQQYWGFFAIYTKFIMMAISTINKKLLILQSFFCLIEFCLLWRQQPYYLNNLNRTNLTLLLLFQVVIHCLMLTDNSIIFLLIFFINIFPIINITNYLLSKINQLNREQIINLKQIINAKFPKLEKYSRIEKDIQKINNQQVFRNVTRRSFLTSSKFQSQSLKRISLIQNKISEIELGTYQSES